MSKKVDVTQAQIKTANIEIKAITLNGKQMTLAVFKQLQDEKLINTGEGIKLNGIPWGKVNYHNKDCSQSPHLHIIWQQGNNLFKDTVFRSLIDMEDNGCCFDYEDECIFAKELNNLYAFLNRYGDSPRSFEERELSDIKKRITECWGGFLLSDILKKHEEGKVLFDLSSIAREYHQSKGRIKSLEESWKQMYFSLSELDQLFIAV